MRTAEIVATVPHPAGALRAGARRDRRRGPRGRRLAPGRDGRAVPAQRPNPRFSPLGSYVYPLDGDGMVHGLWVRDGRARYANRFGPHPGADGGGARGPGAVGRALWGGLMSGIVPGVEDVGPELAGSWKDLPDINVVRHGGRLHPLADWTTPFALSPDLATLGRETFGGAIPAGITAHPKVDPARWRCSATRWSRPSSCWASAAWRWAGRRAGRGSEFLAALGGDPQPHQQGAVGGSAGVQAAAVVAGSRVRACATRRWSRTVRSSNPTHQLSQCAHERSPGPAQPSRVSNFASSCRNRQPRIVGVLLGIAGAGTALGPVVGGVLVTTAGWRWVFPLNVPIAVLALWGGRRLPLLRGRRHGEKHRREQRQALPQMPSPDLL